MYASLVPVGLPLLVQRKTRSAQLFTAFSFSGTNY